MRPKITRTDRWYQSRLSKYFDEHFIGYDDSVTWYVNPAPNQWMFNIPETGERIKLTCDVKGNVSVETYPMKGTDQR